MTDLPQISIVVPSYNQARFLPEALDSIFRQGYPRLEVVVVDAASTDGSVDIIRSYSDRLKFWRSEPDSGQSAAITEGMTHCAGDLVGWLNSDDYYFGDALWHLARAFRAHPDCGLYVGNGFRYDQQSGIHTPFCRHHIAINRKALRDGLDYILQPSTFFLRKAWQDVGGINPELHYCMDWDIYIRITDRYPVAAINEFLAVSREHGETKTSSGRMKRIVELWRMIQSHAGEEITPGSLYYLFETLLDMTRDKFDPRVREFVYSAMCATRPSLTREPGNNGIFPFWGDAQDTIHMPFVQASPSRRDCRDLADPPSISIVTPSFNQARYLGQTLESILHQTYPNLELIVMDGASTDGSAEIIKQYQDRLSYWESQPDRGPSHAINKGLRRAKGEIVSWLNSDDLLSDGALWEVAKAFREDPDLDLVYANALYIDEQNRLFLADHGTHKTGLYYGEMQQLQRVPAYWTYVHSVPQPTVFFRRRLLETCGYLNESFHNIFDFELFFRFMWKAKTRKIERVQAFYRIHAASKTSDWNKFLIELYRFSRPWWPKLREPQFRNTLRQFVGSYMARRFPGRARDFRFWTASGIVALSAIARVGNPEAMRLSFMDPPAPTASPAPAVQKVPEHIEIKAHAGGTHFRAIDRAVQRFKSVFCSFIYPRHPGLFGGEIRDFHILRGLLSVSRVEFVALYSPAQDGRADYLLPYLDALHTYDSITKLHPDQVRANALQMSMFSRLVDKLRRNDFPLPGWKYHRDVTTRFPVLKACFERALPRVLEKMQPDFFFVSPQSNPAALTIRSEEPRPKFILASYDVETVRLRRLAEGTPWFRRAGAEWEARRAARFEKVNLPLFDGIIAVSELDREIFIRNFGINPDRVLVIENSVDPDYFAFQARTTADSPNIVFVGNLSYSPNYQAATRLLEEIMPKLREHHPKACAWIVGQGADARLSSLAVAGQAVITGKVEDVRPYLAMASVACIPLATGSGTKYKVLEAMSAGVPVVCTSMAAEGLHLEKGKHVLLAESNTDLAQAIERLVGDPVLNSHIARDARRHVENHYSWDANLTRLSPWLEFLRSEPHQGVGGRSSS